MENNSKNHLMGLSTETKKLINKGVFSLYSLFEKESGATYVLYTDTTTFLLSETGTIIQEFAGIRKFKATNSITFPELVSPTISLGKYNIA